MLSWIMKAIGFGGCRHDWQQSQRPIEGDAIRWCSKCGETEKFEPDCGGWTAGHWDKFNNPLFNHNHWDL